MSAPEGPIEVARLLRPQTKLDIVVKSDLIAGQADVRGSVILDLDPTQMVVAQTSPPIPTSMIGQSVEATVVRRSLINRDGVRWGWASRILGLNNNYRLSPQDSNSRTAPVIFMSLPPGKHLARSNVRLAYRLEAGPVDGIEISVTPSPKTVTLVNFSAGGLMLATSPPPAFSVGQPLSFTLTFPETQHYFRTVIKGRAKVVRVDYEYGETKAWYGLKFMDLGPEASRDLGKIINVFMREEQRRRNRE